VFAAAAAVSAQAVTIKSPDTNTIVDVDFNPADSTVTYTVKIFDPAANTVNTMIETSPLGFVTEMGDFSKGLTLVGWEEGKRSDSYSIWQGKQKDIDYAANTLQVNLKNADGKKFNIEFEVSDNNVGYRYSLPIHKDTRCAVVEKEVSGFRLPEGTTTFLTPFALPMKGWQRTQPSYEEYYEADAPLTKESKYKNGYTFPALFHVGDKGWVLIGETGVTGRYCASHLSDPSADVETPEEWQAANAEAVMTGNWAEDLVSVAQTQLGYEQSEKNFELDPAAGAAPSPTGILPPFYHIPRPAANRRS